MRCYACNDELTDYEATRKSKITKQYIDLCDTCFNEVSDIFEEIEDNQDLLDEETDTPDENLST